MITQQQALEALQSKTESAKRGHRDANGAFVTYDGAAADLNALARYVTTLESVLRQYIEQGAHPGAAKSLNAMAADLLRPYLKLGQKVIWRESFRWHDDNGVLSNHYDGMELEQLSDAFGYDWHYDMNLKHAAIVWDKVAAPQPQQEQP